MESLLPNPLPPPSFFPRFGGQSNSFTPINKFGHGNDPLEFPSLSACFGHGNDQLEFPSVSASHSCFATLTAKTSSSGILARATAAAGGGGSLYDVLGVSPSATSDEIKSSYRKLALKYHPDVSKQANAQEKFIRIKNACDTLLDSDSRREYDYGRRRTTQPTSSRSASTTRKKNHSNHSKSRGRKRRTYYYYYGTGGLHFTISESWTNGRRGTSSTSKHQSRKGTYDENYYYSNETILWVWYLFHGLHSLH
ncbi:dnaJ protein ERDJ3A-like [Papaver somniferum]|uniref:dnaJ protein ERDJ3A-like n=1 Tax=Papaver somniferum TaxID=3469 RepID=UPI000E6FD1BA|nr:dnaJ protein ERDJ3A-like [Papaver somniferum]